MKKIIIIFIGLAVLSSCTEDILDVEYKESLTVENWYQTSDDFQMAINSCYISLMQRGAFALRYMLDFGTWEDRTIFESTVQDKITVAPSDNSVDEVWDAYYTGVYRTSKVLEQLNQKGVDGIKDMTQENFDYIAAQAKVLRSMYYFYLTVIFDRPILYTEADLPIDLLEDQVNGDQMELWNQIEKDLNEAIPDLKLKSELPLDEIGRITSGAAYALLGKAMLYKHYYYHLRFTGSGSAEDLADLSKAKSAFQEVMNSSEYGLVQPQSPKTELDYLYACLSNTAFKDLPSENNLYMSENNNESIWEVQFADHKSFNDELWQPGHWGPGAINAKYFSPHVSSFKNWEANPSMYYAFETVGAPAPFDRDPRCYASLYFDGDLMDVDPDSPYFVGYQGRINNKGIAAGRGLKIPPGTIGLGVKKYCFPVYWDGLYAPTNEPTNRRIIRYADLLLMYSEVMYNLGDDGTGLAALNEVRDRVDMPHVGMLTTEAIIHERDVELAFEGHRWFDLIRWSMDPAWNIDWTALDWGIDALNTIQPFTVGKNEFLPIPLFEIDLSHGSLTQNPGW